MMSRRITFLIGLILAGLTLQAQTLGLRSPGTKLRQIDTDTVQIIFAEGQEQQAQRVANIVHTMARRFPIQGSDALRKIPVLLQGATDVSNGYVGLGPWRSEFYLSPPVNSFRLGSLPWSELLAIHEFRHVQQRSVGRRGLSKLVSVLFGQEAYSGILNLSWPDWYTEGDAVIAETVLSGQGRGRLPSFLNAYREKIMSGEYWPYQKARNGSYKEVIPSQYPLGFLLQNYGREKYGQGFWDSVALKSAAFKGGLFYPFSESVRKRTGLTTPEFYRDAMDHYRARWLANGEADTDLGGQQLGPEPLRYADYSYPVYNREGDLYAVKRTFDQTATIYHVDGPVEEKIIAMGSTVEPQFSHAANKLCWTERRLHPRWSREDYSVIVVYDLERGNKRQLTHKSSYFSPALSADGKRIAALYDNDLQEFVVHVLDATRGDIKQVLPNPDNYYFSYPTWDGDAFIISAARDQSGRMALTRQSLADGGIEVLTDFSYSVIGRPAIVDEWVYFAKGSGESDQVFRLHLESRVVEQLTNGMTSRYQPAVHAPTGLLTVAEYSLAGKKLVQVPIADLIPTRSQQPENSSLLFVGSDENNILDDLPGRTFDTRPYSHFTKPINIHSWNVFEEDPVYGIELLSDNILNSVSWRNGFRYNSNDKSYGPFSEMTIGVWYPEILLSYSGWRRNGDDELGEREIWYTQQVNGGMRIPFQAYSGPYHQSASLYSGYGWLWTKGDREGNFGFLSHSFVFANRRILARQHPMTRFGQAVRVSYSHSTDDSSINQFNIRTDWSIPSPIRNHVLWLQFDYKRDRGNIFSDVFNYARGYSRISSDWSYRAGVNYQMPLIYPDLGIAGLVYFKRLRANLFADYMRSSLDTDVTTLRSVGVELMFDLELFNVEPVTVGWRWSHLLDSDPSEPERSYRFGFFTPFERL